MPLKPLLHGIRQIHGRPAEVNPGQAMPAFEILDHMLMVGGVADLGDAEESDQLLFGHDCEGLHFHSALHRHLGKNISGVCRYTVDGIQ